MKHCAVAAWSLAALLAGCVEPKSVGEYDRGTFEDLIIGETKDDLLERLEGTKHSFTPMPLSPEREDNWIHMASTERVTAMDKKERRFLMESDLWEAGFVGYSTGCNCPASKLYFSDGRLTKVRVECWVCK